MTSNDPEAIRRDIEQTRQSLSQDVDVLNEKVNPRYAVQRRKEAAASSLTRAKDKVMGSVPSSPSMSSGGGTGSGGSGGTARAMGDRLSSAPDMARSQAQGNPLAAGLIAFGVGWLASSLLPSSQAEQQAARAVQERASDLAQPAKEMAQDAASQLQGSAQQAADSVKATAQDATEQVKGEAQSVKDDVQGQAQSSAESVRSQSGSSS
ncbi:MAG: hypothetical protein K0Q93_244 [Nocardioidaceae bacterium]|jgi:hypothetical protein|nr:hypothetical protein [Nocardioidaceae bacterium]